MHVVGHPPPAPLEQATYSLAGSTGLYYLRNVLHEDNSSVTYIVKLTTEEANVTSYFWVVSGFHACNCIIYYVTCVYVWLLILYV